MYNKGAFKVHATGGTKSESSCNVFQGATFNLHRQRGLIYVLACSVPLLSACGGGSTEAIPNIDFTASKTTVSAGEPVTLSWRVQDAPKVSLSGVTATPQSSAVVAPAQTTTYVLSATTASGASFTKSVTISVPDARHIATVAVNTTNPGATIPNDFLGFSHPWAQAQMMMGDPAVGVNPIYRQLIKNLTDYNGGPFPIRIGGSVTDSTIAPNNGTVRAFASFYNDFKALGKETPFMLGLNFADTDPNLGPLQAKQYLQDMPAGSVTAFQIGNEPDLMVFQRHRPAGYTFAQYTAEARAYADRVVSAVPNAPQFIGPSAAFVAGATMASRLSAIPMDDQGFTSYIETMKPRLGIVGQHSYMAMGSGCGTKQQSGVLLEPESSTREARMLTPYINIAKAAGKPYRVDEMNSIACEGEDGVTNAFEQALWTPDALFEFANAGVSGVNLITKNWNRMSKDDAYGAFIFNIPESQYRNLNNIAASTWTPPADAFKAGQNEYTLKAVLPLYYGMLFFAEATGNQVNLLPTTLNTSANIKAWATRDAKTQRVNVLLINKDPNAAGTVEVNIPGYNTAVVQRMRAPSFSAKSGITIAGQTFDGSQDGKPLGTRYGETLASTGNGFKVSVERVSAVMLTLSK